MEGKRWRKVQGTVATRMQMPSRHGAHSLHHLLTAQTKARLTVYCLLLPSPRGCQHGLGMKIRINEGSWFLTWEPQDPWVSKTGSTMVGQTGLEPMILYFLHPGITGASHHACWLMFFL